MKKELKKKFEQTIKNNIEGIKLWYHYGRRFENEIRKRVNKVRMSNKYYITEINEEMREELSRIGREISQNGMKKETGKRKKVYELFSTIGEDKIKMVWKFSANQIAKLKKVQIKEIKEYFEKNENNSREIRN